MKNTYKILFSLVVLMTTTFCGAATQEHQIRSSFKKLKSFSKLPEVKVKSFFKSPTTYEKTMNEEEYSIVFPGLPSDFYFSLNDGDYEILKQSLLPCDCNEEVCEDFEGDYDLVKETIELILPQEAQLSVYHNRKALFGLAVSPLKRNRSEYVALLTRWLETATEDLLEEDEAGIQWSLSQEKGNPCVSFSLIDEEDESLIGKLIITEKNIYFAACYTDHMKPKTLEKAESFLASFSIK